MHYYNIKYVSVYLHWNLDK